MNQLEEMQSFVRIVEAGSITKAAEQMNTVKSSISRKLSQLENRLGISLITRTTRSQTLTDAGEHFYQQCLRIISDINELESSINSKNTALSGRIKIAAPLSFGLAKLCPILKQFNDLHPNITFDMDFNDRQVDLIEEGFDLAIRIADLTDSSLIARRLTTVNLMLCASPNYLQEHGTPKTPEDLTQGHRKLHYHLSLDHWHFKSTSGKNYRINVPRGNISTNNGDFLCQAAIAGYGLVYLPDFICSDALQTGQLINILPDYMGDNKVGAYAIYPQTRHLSERVRTLIDFLSDYFSQTKL